MCNLKYSKLLSKGRTEPSVPSAEAGQAAPRGKLGEDQCGSRSPCTGEGCWHWSRGQVGTSCGGSVGAGAWGILFLSERGWGLWGLEGDGPGMSGDPEASQHLSESFSTHSLSAPSD